MNPTVAVSHLSKSFGRAQAVKDVSFEVMPGEIFGLLGPNGAGKTTAIRMMLDIFKPDAGEVSEAEIIQFARDNLAHFKCPRHVVFGELPKTSTGKIQKFVLRERANA